MKTRFSITTKSAIWLVLSTSLLLAQDKTSDSTTWVSVPNQTGQFYLIQKTLGTQLMLTPNESFFPQLGLKAEGSSLQADIDNLNGGKSFSAIAGWNRGLKAEWGIWIPASNAAITITINCSGDGEFTTAIDGHKKQMANNQSVEFKLTNSGRHIVSVECTKPAKNLELHSLQIEHVPMDSGVIRKRWRPAAAHTKFSSSVAPKQVRLWIMEMDAVPSDLGFYSPITTPFGYYGPTWKADGTVNSGMNFSLWSYGRNQPQPPFSQLSHLIGIGNLKAKFGRFGHEGTGVKIRDWEPLEGQQGQRQAFALRLEPGEIYDTYSSYYYSTKKERWEFFGAGRKHNNGKPLDSLWVGSFVEVPGPPSVQRTGVYPRRMKYRGWVVDSKANLHALDTMSNGNVDRSSGYTHTNRGTTDDGWFFLETGGWTFRTAPNGGADIVVAPETNQSQPDFLDATSLETLQSIPCQITIDKVVRHGKKVVVEFDLDSTAKTSEITAYWGQSDRLTFTESWTNHQRIGEFTNGNHRLDLAVTDVDGPLFVRLFARNTAGQYWTTEAAEK